MSSKKSFADDYGRVGKLIGGDSKIGNDCNCNTNFSEQNRSSNESACSSSSVSTLHTLPTLPSVAHELLDRYGVQISDSMKSFPRRDSYDDNVIKPKGGTRGTGDINDGNDITATSTAATVCTSLSYTTEKELWTNASSGVTVTYQPSSTSTAVDITRVMVADTDSINRLSSSLPDADMPDADMQSNSVGVEVKATERLIKNPAGTGVHSEPEAMADGDPIDNEERLPKEEEGFEGETEEGEYDQFNDKDRDKSIPTSIGGADSGLVNSVSSLGENTFAVVDAAIALKDELYKYMREEASMFSWFQEALGDGVWYSSLEPYNSWYSPAYKESFGYDADADFPSNWWMENIFPDDLLKAVEAYKDHVENGAPYDLVVRYRHKDGSTVWIRCHGKAIFDKYGNPIRMLGAHNNITALMKVQEELKEKEAILDLLTSTSLDGYWDWNLVTGELHMSSRFKSLLGYADDELPNRIETWWSLLVPDDVPKVQDAIEKCKSERHQEQLLNIVLRYRRKNGTIARMLAQGVAQSVPVSPPPSSDTDIASSRQWVRMFGTHTDVSYLEEARAARDASAAKTIFLATMSHEIRTPLNAVLGMAQVLMTTNLTDEQRDCVTTLHNSGAHLLSLINDILDFSQIDSGFVNLASEDVDIQRTVRDVLDVLQHSAEQKGVSLTFHTHIPAGIQFRGDSERIRQIVFNLLGNAVKFTSKGSINVSLKLKTAPTTSNVPQHKHFQDSINQPKTQDGVQLVIQDTGCGIADDQVDHIFDDFRQAGHEIRSNYGGSGLGLSICKRLIQAMGGSIEVQSVHGKGSVFTVWLPGCPQATSRSSSVSRQGLRSSEMFQNEELRNPTVNIQGEQKQKNSKEATANKSRQTMHVNQRHTAALLHGNNDNQRRMAALQHCDTASTLNKKAPEKNHEDCRILCEYETESVKPVGVLQRLMPVDKNTGKECRTNAYNVDGPLPIPEAKEYVFLYEELEFEDRRGSVETALLGAGLIVHRVADANDALQKMSTKVNEMASVYNTMQTANTSAPLSFSLIVHQQGCKSTSSWQRFFNALLYNIPLKSGSHSQSFPHPPIHIFDVGRRASFCINDQCQGRYHTLHAYPTSDELRDEFLVKDRTRSSAVQDMIGGSTAIGFSNTGLFHSRDRSLSVSREIQQESLFSGCSHYAIDKANQNQDNKRNSAGNPILSNQSTSTPDASLPSDRRLKILIAEDNLINQKVLRKLLSSFPCEMEIANNGIEAVELSKKRKFDLIFMDLIMPELDGLGASKIIRQTNPTIPIVALTANATTEDRNECFDAGMNDFITKPVSIDALRKILRCITFDIPLANPGIS